MSSNIVEQHIPSHPPLEILEASTRCNLFPMKSYPISSFSSAGCRCCNLHQCRDGDEVWSFLCPIQQWSDFDNRTGPRTSLKFLNDLWRWPEHVILYKMRNLCNWKLCRILDIYIFHYISNNFSKESKDRYTIYIYIYTYLQRIYIYTYTYLQRIHIYIYMLHFKEASSCVFGSLPPQKVVVKIFPGEGDTQTLSTRYFSRVLWLAPSSDAWIFRGFFQVKIVVKIFFHHQNHMSHEIKNTGCLGFI